MNYARFVIPTAIREFPDSPPPNLTLGALGIEDGFAAAPAVSRSSTPRSVAEDFFCLISGNLLGAFFAPNSIRPDPQAIAPTPCFAASESSFAAGPRGFFSPRSHLLTTPVVTLR